MGAAGKPAAARPDIGQPGIVGNTAVAAALPPQLAAACILLAALPHIGPVGHMGRMQ